MSTAIYMRVSTAEQAQKGSSLKDQRERLLGECKRRGWTVAPEHIFIDAGVSGTTRKRPAFQHMMEAAARGELQRVVFSSIDRIARNMNHFTSIEAELAAVDCAIVSLKEEFDTTKAHGRLIMNMLGSIAQFEADQLKERMRMGKEQKFAAGGWVDGTVPFGYVRTEHGDLAPHPQEAPVVKRIFQLWLSGKSQSDICRALVADGIPTVRKGTWRCRAVRYILTNPVYIGLIVWKGTTTRGTHPKLITPATFRKAAERFTPGSGAE